MSGLADLLEPAEESTPRPLLRGARLWGALGAAAAFGLLLGHFATRPADKPVAASMAADLPSPPALAAPDLFGPRDPEGASDKAVARHPVSGTPEHGTRTAPEAKASPAKGETPAVAASSAVASSPESAAPEAAPAAADKAPPAPPENPLAQPIDAGSEGLSKQHAAIAIGVAARTAQGCLPADDTRRSMGVSLTFAPSGRVTRATITSGPHRGTPAGSCIAQHLAAATIRPFEGQPVTVVTSIHVR